MTSTNNGVDELANLLKKAEVRQENIVSFKGRGLKLDTAEDAKDVIDAINKCNDVQVLELGGNTIGVDACKGIADALKNKTELQKCLWADIFTGRMRSEIPPALRSLGSAIIAASAQLVEIDLSDNAFGPAGIESCVELLKSKACYTLEVLKFNNNGLGIGGKILAKTLIECHKSSTACGKPLTLKVFIAGRNRLENACAIALAEAFKTIGTLEEIHMPQNGIQHQGVTALADAVKHSKNLKHINLNDNTFTKRGAESMSNAIMEINSLEIINFGDCLVRTEGAIAIGNALSNSNPNLKEINLSFGEIHLQGALSVCRGVKNKEHLACVNLNGNQLGEDGIEHITKLAKESGFEGSLESMDDDEGSESESENDKDETESSEEEDKEDKKEVTQHKHITSPSLIPSPTANGHTKHDLMPLPILKKLESDINNFASIVTSAHLKALSEGQRKEIIQKAVSVNKEPEEFTDDAIKIAGFLVSKIPTPSGSRNSLEEPILDCVNTFMRAALDKAEDNPMIVINRILIRFGLLKSEDKRIKAMPNPECVGIVLTNVVKDAIINQSTKKTIRAMVAKDNKVWEKHVNLRNKLLELLY